MPDGKARVVPLVNRVAKVTRSRRKTCLLGRLRIRGFLDNVLMFDERVNHPAGADMADVVKHHMTMLFGPDESKWADKVNLPHLIEIEFLDEPNVEQRFMRLGTDPRRMVKPYEVDLTNPEAALQKLLEQYR